MGFLLEVAKQGAEHVLRSLEPDEGFQPVVIAGNDEGGGVIQGVPPWDEDRNMAKLASFIAAILNARSHANTDHFVVVIDSLSATAKEDEVEVDEHGHTRPMVMPRDNPAAVEALMLAEVEAGFHTAFWTLTYHRDDQGRRVIGKWVDEQARTGHTMGGQFPEVFNAASRMPMDDEMVKTAVELARVTYPDLEAECLERIGEW